MKIVKPTLILTVGLGLGFANPLANAQSTTNHTSATTSNSSQHVESWHPAKGQSCVQQTVLPSQAKIYGIIEPANQHWARALMGSHQPSPESLKAAQTNCKVTPKPNKHHSH